MFDPAVVGSLNAGDSIATVHSLRLPERVLEQTPVDRQRWALAGRIAHRFASSTIRFEERLYIDNWGTKATTTDSTYFYDLSPTFRVWPHARFHAQTGVSFWKLAYTAQWNSGVLTVPALRTGDRELGPLMTGTGGLGTRLAFGPDNTWGLTIAADFVYTRFLDHLFIKQRFGYFGKTVFEVAFE
jgi:hypothetical protein